MPKLNLGTPPPAYLGGTCTVGSWLRDHPGDADELRRALANPAWTIPALADELAGQGVRLDRQAISRHRRGLCKCIERGLA